MGGSSTTLKESPYEVALGQISLEKWNMYQNTFKPVENQFMQRVDQLGSGQQLKMAGDLAADEVSRQYAPQIQTAASTLMQRGAAPGSGAYAMGLEQARLGGAQAQSLAAINAEQGQRDRYRAGLQAVLGIGSGQSTLAQNSLANVAQQSVDAAKQQTALDWGNRAEVIRTVGGLGGIATGYGLSAVNK